MTSSLIGAVPYKSCQLEPMTESDHSSPSESSASGSGCSTFFEAEAYLKSVGIDDDLLFKDIAQLKPINSFEKQKSLCFKVNQAFEHYRLPYRFALSEGVSKNSNLSQLKSDPRGLETKECIVVCHKLDCLTSSLEKQGILIGDWVSTQTVDDLEHNQESVVLVSSETIASSAPKLLLRLESIDNLEDFVDNHIAETPSVKSKPLDKYPKRLKSNERAKSIRQISEVLSPQNTFGISWGDEFVLDSSEVDSPNSTDVEEKEKEDNAAESSADSTHSFDDDYSDVDYFKPSIPKRRKRLSESGELNKIIEADTLGDAVAKTTTQIDDSQQSLAQLTVKQYKNTASLVDEFKELRKKLEPEKTLTTSSTEECLSMPRSPKRYPLTGAQCRSASSSPKPLTLNNPQYLDAVSLSHKRPNSAPVNILTLDKAIKLFQLTDYLIRDYQSELSCLESQLQAQVCFACNTDDAYYRQIDLNSKLNLLSVFQKNIKNYITQNTSGSIAPGFQGLGTETSTLVHTYLPNMKDDLHYPELRDLDDILTPLPPGLLPEDGANSFEASTNASKSSNAFNFSAPHSTIGIKRAADSSVKSGSAPKKMKFTNVAGVTTQLFEKIDGLIHCNGQKIECKTFAFNLGMLDKLISAHLKEHNKIDIGWLVEEYNAKGLMTVPYKLVLERAKEVLAASVKALQSQATAHSRSQLQLGNTY